MEGIWDNILKCNYTKDKEKLVALQGHSVWCHKAKKQTDSCLNLCSPFSQLKQVQTNRMAADKKYPKCLGQDLGDIEVI